MRSAYLYRTHRTVEFSLTGLVFFVALLATALAMGAALAHAFGMPAKIGLSRDEYFVVQQIYAGWDRLSWLLLVELGAMVAVAILTRHDSTAFWFALAAILLLLAAQGLFWGFTQPANVATNNWTQVPENWDSLRRQWEYSHLGGAVLQVLAMAALTVAVLRRRPN